MCKLTAQPCGLAEELPEVVATPAVNQVTLHATVLHLVLRRQCVVEAAVVGSQASEGVFLAPIVRQPVTNVEDRIIMLATVRLRP